MSAAGYLVHRIYSNVVRTGSDSQTGYQYDLVYHVRNKARGGNRNRRSEDELARLS